MSHRKKTGRSYSSKTAPKPKVAPARLGGRQIKIEESGDDNVVYTLFSSVPNNGTHACKTFFLEFARRPIVASGGLVAGKIHDLITSPSEEKSAEMLKLIEELKEAKEVEYPELKRISSANTVSEHVNNYLTYLTDLISTILRSNPLALRSTKTVTIEEVLKSGTMDEFINDQVEQEILSLAQKGYPEIKKYIEGFGLKLVEDPSEEKYIFRGVMDRNLFTHKRGIIDRKYLDKLEAEGFDCSQLTLGMHLADSNPYPPPEIMKSTVRSVAFLEKTAVEKYSLPVERIGLGILFSGDPSKKEMNEILLKANFEVSLGADSDPD